MSGLDLSETSTRDQVIYLNNSEEPSVVAVDTTKI